MHTHMHICTQYNSPIFLLSLLLDEVMASKIDGGTGNGLIW